MLHSVWAGKDALRCVRGIPVRASSKVTAVQKNKQGERAFLNPTIAAGNYRLEVYSRMATIGPVRIGYFQEPHTVL